MPLDAKIHPDADPDVIFILDGVTHEADPTIDVDAISKDGTIYFTPETCFDLEAMMVRVATFARALAVHAWPEEMASFNIAFGTNDAGLAEVMFCQPPEIFYALGTQHPKLIDDLFGRKNITQFVHARMTRGGGLEIELDDSSAPTLADLEKIGAIFGRFLNQDNELTSPDRAEELLGLARPEIEALFVESGRSIKKISFLAQIHLTIGGASVDGRKIVRNEIATVENDKIQGFTCPTNMPRNSVSPQVTTLLGTFERTGMVCKDRPKILH